MTLFKNGAYKSKVCCLCDTLICYKNDCWINIEDFRNENVRRAFETVQSKNPYNLSSDTRRALKKQYKQKVHTKEKFLNDYYLSPNSYGGIIDDYKNTTTKRKTASNNKKKKVTKNTVIETKVLGSCTKCKIAIERLIKKRSKKIGQVPYNCIANGLYIGYPPKEITDLNEVELSILTLLPTQKHVFSIMGGAHKAIKGWHTMFENDVQYGNRVINSINSDILADSLTTDKIAVVFCGPFTKTQKAIAMEKTKVDIHKLKRALCWLKKNNSHYKHIDENVVYIEPKYVDCSTEIDKKDTNVEQVFEMAAVFPDDSCQTTSINGGYNNTEDFKQMCLRKLYQNTKLEKETSLIYRHTPKVARDYVKDNLLKAFPLQFPYGIGNMTVSNKKRSGHEYYQHLISLSSPRFHEANFIVILYNMFEKERMVRKSYFKVSDQENEDFGNIQESEIKQAIDRYIEDKSGSDVSDIFLQKLKAVTGGMSNSRTSNYTARQKMFSTISHFGLPCVLFTITPEDSMNFRIMTMARTGNRVDPPKLNCQDKELHDFVKESEDIRIKYPGLCSHDFENIVNITIEDLIGWDTEQRINIPNKGLFGDVDSWFMAVEEQGRKTLHLHCLIWVKGWNRTLKGLHSKCKTTRDKWETGMLNYSKQIMTATFLSDENIKCKCGEDLKSFIKCSDQDLRNLRFKNGYTKFGGKAIYMCNKCETTYTSNDLAKIAIDEKLNYSQSLGEESLDFTNSAFQKDALWFQSTISSKRKALMELYIMHQLNNQQKTNIVQLPKSHEYQKMNSINTGLRNLHNCNHCTKCFKGKSDCRMKIPNRECQQENILFENTFTNWRSWTGEEEDINLFVREQQRAHIDAFVNVHNERASMFIGCNTNVIFGVDGGSIIYLTNYVSKSTIEDDKKHFTEAAQNMIKRLNDKKREENINTDSGDNVQNDTTDDTILLGIKTIIGSALHATRNHYCAAPMAAYLIKNESRFRSSHDFGYVNLKNFLMNPDEQMNRIDSIDYTYNGRPYKKSKTMDYILRPDHMKDICLHEFISKYKLTKKRKKDDESIGFIQLQSKNKNRKISHPSHDNMTIKKNSINTIPVINHYDFDNTCQYGVHQINQDISDCSPSELYSMERNARQSSLLFIPFRDVTKLKDENDSYLYKFRKFITLQQEQNEPSHKIKNYQMQILQNIQDCMNSNNAGRPPDILERITSNLTQDVQFTGNESDESDEEDMDLDENAHSEMDEFNSKRRPTRDSFNRLLLHTKNIIKNPDNGDGMIRSLIIPNTHSKIFFQSEIQYKNYDNQYKNSNQIGLCTGHVRMQERKTNSSLNQDKNITYSSSLRDIHKYSYSVFGNDEDQHTAFVLIVASFILQFAEENQDHHGLTRHEITSLKALFKNKDKKLICFLSGPGGSGKSRVIHAVTDYCKNFFIHKNLTFTKRTIIVSALTGAAAVSIHGQTTHSALHLNCKLNDTSCKDEKWTTRKKNFEQTYMIIIDEISFANSDILKNINDRLNILKDNNNPNVVFGNMPIIFSGDFSQLKPVTGLSLMSDRTNYLWYEMVNTFIELKSNHRFKNDRTWGDILQNMRTKGLNDNDIDKINKRVVNGTDINEKDIPDNAVYATNTNQQRADINEKIFLKYIHENGSNNCICIKTGNIKSHNSKTNKCEDAKQYTKDVIHSTCTDAHCVALNKMTRYDPMLKLYVGRRLMINSNIDVENSIANGTICTFKGVVLKPESTTDCVEQILIDTHIVDCIESTHIQSIIVQLNDGDGRTYYIQPKQYTLRNIHYMHNFQTCINSGKNNLRFTRKFSMEAFPLNIANAVTVHKLQGRSITSLVITGWSKKDNFNYVMLSRCRTLDGIFLKSKLQDKSEMSDLCKQFYTFFRQEKKKPKSTEYILN